MEKLDLSLSKEKSKLVNIWDGTNGFDFLGFHHRKFAKHNKGGSKVYILTHVPSKKAMKKMRQNIRECIGPRSQLYRGINDVVEELNSKIRGFRNYYAITPMAKRWLNRIDWYVLERLNLFWNKKRKVRHKHGKIGELMKMTDGILLKLTG
jgi:hypothetical protein